MLRCASVSRWLTSRSANSPSHRARPRDALDHGHRLLCLAHQRRWRSWSRTRASIGAKSAMCSPAPLFTLPIPASRGTVPTGYNYVMPDQNGWSRYLHFQAAWALVLTGLVYGIASLWTGHFRKRPRTGTARQKLARVPGRDREVSSPRAAGRSRSPLVQRHAANRISRGDLRPLSPGHLDRSRAVSRLRLRASRSPSPRWAAGNPRARCISSSQDSSSSSSWSTWPWLFSLDSPLACEL